MTTYYVGKGGNDANSGITWADRKLTLNGAEDVPVVAGDTVIVGPGVYREALTVDVSGSVGNLITYEGDWIGHRTDGIGGPVRITGSDNDQTATRATCVDASAAKRDYRAFIGLLFDLASGNAIDGGNLGSSGWRISYCTFMHNDRGLNTEGAMATSADDWTITNCVGIDNTKTVFRTYTLWGDHNDGWVCYNNLMLFGGKFGIAATNTDNIDLRNNTIWSRHWDTSYAVSCAAASTGGTAYNNLIVGASYGIYAVANIVYDYNWVYGCTIIFMGGTDGGHNETGGSSDNLPFFGLPDLLTGGFMMPWREWWVPGNGSPARQVSGASAATDDLFGRTRPVTAGKRTVGAFQWVPKELETTTVYEGTGANREDDAGRQQMIVPAEAVSHTLTVYVYREANYAGLLPQVRIIQPGQATVELTDTGAAGAWNTLTHTWTPAAAPEFFIVELVSRNTNGGADGTLWDSLSIVAA